MARQAAQAMSSFSPTQRQYLVLYRLAQMGYARREHMIRACFRDVPDSERTFAEEIEPLVREQGKRGSTSPIPVLIAEHPESGLLHLNRPGRASLDSAGGSASRQAFATATPDTEPTYFRGRDDRGIPIPYNLKPLPSERRTTANANLDEYVGIADVFTRFVECEAGLLTAGVEKWRLERVEVVAKPSDVTFTVDNRKVELRPDGLVILHRRNADGHLDVDWFYVEYEETSTPSKKLESLRQYAQFFWRGEFARLWNAEYRYTYDLTEINGGNEVEKPIFKVLVIVEEGDGSGYLDGLLREFRFLKDTGLRYRELGFPSDVMGLGQFLFCRRAEFVAAEHALASVWLNGANYQRRLSEGDWRLVTCLG